MVALCVAAVVVVRLALLTAPLTSDEAGFLMVGGQWSPGPSLYGHYWVDRPPGLVSLFALAHLLGGQVALRVLGALAAAGSVLAAAALGRCLAPRRRDAAPACAVLVAALVSTPLLDVAEVDGELLALPFLLLGLVLLLRAVPAAGRTRPAGWATLGWAAGAGAAGVAAASVKQDMVDVLVAASVLVLVLLRRRRVRDAVVLLGGLALGGLGVGGALLALAWARGTSPAGLWQAIVVFRLQAGALIAAEGSSAGQVRGEHLLVALVLTGAPAVLLLALRLGGPVRVGRSNLMRPGGAAVAPGRVALAVLAWEAVGVVGGGSYWLHYLVGLVPGLVLLLAACLGRGGTPTWRAGLSAPGVRWVLAPVVASTVIGLAFLAVHPPTRSVQDIRVIDYLAAHRAPGDTAVTAFGDPALIEQAGLASPYPDLWSLPVRVHDPHLRAFSRLLRGPDHPSWIVVQGTSLASWGLDASTADRVAARHYEVVLTAGDLEVLHRDA